MRIILASASPRRLALLDQIGIKPDLVINVNCCEAPLLGELPRNLADRLARVKALAAPAEIGDVIIAADTVVAVGRRILDKTEDKDQALKHLTLLSGRRHCVYTAVAVRSGDRVLCRNVISNLRVKRLSAGEIEAYLATDEWRGKAGSYAIQGHFARFVPWIQGSYSAIMGLPLSETSTLLSTFRVP